MLQFITSRGGKEARSARERDSFRWVSGHASLRLFPRWPNAQVLDDQNFRRRFRVSNYRTTTRVNPFVCMMPIRLEVGWNQIQFNLSDLTRRAYGTRYIETMRVQVGGQEWAEPPHCHGWLVINSLFYVHVLVLFRFMPTAESGGCISQTDCTQRTSFPLSLNSICQYRTRRTRWHTHARHLLI